MPRFTDGQGNVWEATGPNDPNPVFVQGPQQGQIFTDPAAQYEAPKAQADAERARIGVRGDEVGIANTQNTIQDRQADNARADTQLIADLYAKGLRPDGRGGVELIPNWEKPASQTTLDPIKKAQFQTLEQQLKRVEELYSQGPGSTSGLSGLMDYFPSDANSSFDAASAGLAEVGKAAFRVPGSGDQNASELQLFIDANTPSASDRDATIKEKIRNIRTRLTATQKELGMLPPDGSSPSAFEVNRIISGGSAGAAGFGATEESIPIPPEMQAENEAFLAQWAGNPDPQAYVQFRQQLDQKYGFEGDPQAYAQWAERTAQQMQQGGHTLNPTIPGFTQDMSGTDQFRNNLVNNPVGAGAINYMDAVGFGGVQALAGDQIQALSEAQPVGSLVGDIGGAITATGAIRRLGQNFAKRATPKLLGGGAKAQFGRNLATDATYGAGYGAVTEGDPLSGAVLGAAGSGLGQALGKGLGTIASGVKVSPAVQALRDRNVPLTTGQTLGGVFRTAENKAASLPIVGDMINRRTSESFRGFNRAAYDEGGKPIGFTTSNVGEEAVGEFGDAVSNAYTKATAGANVTPDQQFFDDLVNLQSRKQQLPDELQPRFDRLMDNHTTGISVGGNLTGEQFQRAMTGLKTARSGAASAAKEFAEPYRQAMTGGMDAFEGLMYRGGGDDVVSGLNRANTANKNMKILEDAALDRAKIGTQTGEAEVFLPSQLLAAARKSEKRYGPSDLKDLARAGQEVLPSTVPNSGTADRLQQSMLAGGLLSGAVGYDALTDGTVATPSTLAALALLTAGGTRGGQKLLNGAITLRPEVARRAGQAVNRRSGLFGSAGAALTLRDQN